MLLKLACKKLLKTMAGVFTILLFSLFFGQLTLAGDQTCVNITGRTQVLAPSSETKNAGLFNFDLAIPENYRACAEKGFLEDEFTLSGWVWNTNLGWTSLGGYGNAAPFSNKGIAVGDFAYESKLKFGTPNSAVLRGWWWNDGMGWIALNCQDIAERGRPNFCQTGSNFAVNVNYPNGQNYGVASGYAWSDSLGWVNLSGMRLPRLQDLVVDIQPQIDLQPVGPSGTLLADSSAVYAGVETGAVGYKVLVGFRDERGNSLVGNGRFDFDFRLQFSDRVIAQQVVESNNQLTFLAGQELGNGNNPIVNGKGQLIKRYGGENFFQNNQSAYTYNAQLGMYVSNAIIKSQAPTLDYSQFTAQPGNLLKINGFQFAFKDLSSNRISDALDTQVELPIKIQPPLLTDLYQGSPGRLQMRLGLNEPLSVVSNLANQRVAERWSNVLWKAYFWERTLNNAESKYIVCLDKSNELTGCNVEREDAVTGFAKSESTLRVPGLGGLPSAINLVIDYLAESERDRPAFDFAEGSGLYGVIQYYNSAERRNYSYVTGTLFESALQVIEARFRGGLLSQSSDLTNSNPNTPSLGLRFGSQREAYLRYIAEAARGLDGQCIGQVNNLLSCKLVGGQSSSKAIYWVENDGSENIDPVNLPSVSDLSPNGVKNVLVVLKGQDLVIDENRFFATDGDVIDKKRNLVIVAL